MAGKHGMLFNSLPIRTAHPIATCRPLPWFKGIQGEEEGNSSGVELFRVDGEIKEGLQGDMAGRSAASISKRKQRLRNAWSIFGTAIFDTWRCIVASRLCAPVLKGDRGENR
jgi:hypothetical protein